MTFDDSFFGDGLYTPLVTSVSAQGAPRPTYTADPVAVRVSPQPHAVSRVDEMGRVVVVTVWWVFFRDNPGALNGGLGVRAGDRITYGSLVLIAEGDAVQECANPDALPVWRVDCLRKS